MKVLMVCLGNICRSPLAEGILADKARKAGFNWLVHSAGTAGYHVGEAPHPLSQKVAAAHGIDISQQQCRQFVAADMLEYDRIYVMDVANYAAIQQLSGDLWNPDKVTLILNALHPNRNESVPDPWYGNEKDYQHVFQLLTAACDNIINQYQHPVDVQQPSKL